MSPIDVFLRHACPDWGMGSGPWPVMHRHTAQRILRKHPDIATANLYTRIVCGDLEGVERLLAERPQSAVEPGGPRNWPPLLYLCAGRLQVPDTSDTIPPAGQFTREPDTSDTSDTAVAIARALLDAGADPNVYYPGGNPSIHYTALTCLAGGGEEDSEPHPRREALFALLLERGAEPFDEQLLYNTHFRGDVLWWLTLVHARSVAIGRAAAWDDPAWPMFDMGGSRFLLTRAIMHRDVALAEWLLAHGARPDAAPAAQGTQPPRSLHDEAVMSGVPALVDLLERYGVTPSRHAPDSEEAFADACFRLDRERARALAVRHGATRSPMLLHAAAKRDRADVVALLLDLGTSPDVTDPRQGHQRALHAAAHAGAARAVSLLMDRGAEIDPVDDVHDGTPLWFAMWGRRRRVVDMLAPRSIDLWALSITGHVDRIRELMATRPALATMTGESTPLFFLPDDEAQAMAIAELLLAHGANAAFRRKDGKTAADVARGRAMDGVADRLARSS